MLFLCWYLNIWIPRSLCNRFSRAFRNVSSRLVCIYFRASPDQNLTIFTTHKQSLGQGNVFTPICLSFCSQEEDVSAPLHAGIHTPWADPPRQTPPRQTIPRQTHPSPKILQDTINKWVVRILLKCILVAKFTFNRVNWGKRLAVKLYITTQNLN